MPPIIEFDGVSKWYGNVIGLNKLTLRIPPGTERDVTWAVVPFPAMGTLTGGKEGLWLQPLLPDLIGYSLHHERRDGHAADVFRLGLEKIVIVWKRLCSNDVHIANLFVIVEKVAIQR